MAVKKIVQSVLRSAGYRVERLREPIAGRSVFVLDFILHRLNEMRGGNVRFVQIGANDGIREDPCYAWISAFPWAGVLVEPQSDLAENLRTLHKENPRIAIEEALVSDQVGQETLFYVEGEPAWSGIASTSAAQIRDEHAHKIADFETKLKSKQVRSTTLKSLMEKHSLSEIDFLQVDAEGLDFAILKTVDFNRIRPDVVSYEHCNLSLEDQAECRSLLSVNGYSFASWLGDTVAIQDRLNLVSPDRTQFLGAP